MSQRRYVAVSANVSPSAPQPDGCPVCAEGARQHEGNGQNQSQSDGVGEHTALFPEVGTCQCELRGASHAQHHADAAQKAVDRNGEVQGGESGGAKACGDEPGVGEDVAGYAEDPDDAQGGAADEFVSQGGIVDAG